MNAIQAISGTIEKLSEISSTIAAAVEEQGAATQEISRNVQQAATGTQQVSSNIGDVQRGASETGSASSQVLAAAQSLSGDSNRLKLEVGRFLELGAGGLIALTIRSEAGSSCWLWIADDPNRKRKLPSGSLSSAARGAGNIPRSQNCDCGMGRPIALSETDGECGQ